MKSQAVVYFGFNNPRKHKRGVENVILLQSQSLPNKKIFYIFFDSENAVFKWGNIICIAIQKNIFRYLVLNKIVSVLKKKNNNGLFIHSHNYLMSFFLLRASNVFTVHDGLYYLSKMFGKKNLLAAAIVEKITYLKSRHIHFVSNFSKSMSLYRGKHHSIISNAPLVDRNLFNNISINNKILIVRSIEERVGLNLIIEFAEYLQIFHRTTYTIEIAGKGPLLAYYQRLVIEKKLHNISFLGYVNDEDLHQRYHSCLVCMVPSLYGEGFGLPVIEAYAFNKPVIASNVCAIPEIIIDSSYLFENNLESLVVAFERFIKAYQPTEKYFNYYLEKFSPKFIKEQYCLQLYPKM